MAILMILCAIGGAILGGTLVANFMVLGLIGGILALFDKPTPKPANDYGFPRLEANIAEILAT